MASGRGNPLGVHSLSSPGSSRCAMPGNTVSVIHLVLCDWCKACGYFLQMTIPDALQKFKLPEKL
eukprot:11617332-Alexandrium_andersonii.AAC.1